MSKTYLVVAAFIILAINVTLGAQNWRPVSGSEQANISGLALIEHARQRSVFLVVHDNKKPGQVRAGILTVDGAEAPKYTRLTWLGGEPPVDLEAVTTIPGSAGQFLALTSTGRVYQVKLDAGAKTLALVNSFPVPQIPNDADFEGFALQTISGSLVAFWADRGLTEKPATLFWGKFDLARRAFSQVGSVAVKVPYPEANVRHISDIKVDASGAVFVTAASDPGNDGPFSSAMYLAGVLRVAADGSLQFTAPAAFPRLYHFAYHKVEAFEMVPGPDGGLVFGTDDESLGAAILLTY